MGVVPGVPAFTQSLGRKLWYVLWNENASPGLDLSTRWPQAGGGEEVSGEQPRTSQDSLKGGHRVALVAGPAWCVRETEGPGGDGLGVRGARQAEPVSHS